MPGYAPAMRAALETRHRRTVPLVLPRFLPGPPGPTRATLLFDRLPPPQ